jgi:membrane-bound lytic murein transglycosylase F
MRLLLTLGFVITGFVFSASVSSQPQSFSSRFDARFAKESRLFLPGVDWKLLKAQCYQESLLDPQAVSHAGAMGLCQFMPGTWKDAKKALGLFATASPYDADLSITAAAWYMGKLRGVWTARRPDDDRHRLALACYNAGCGHILKAQKKCGSARHYPDIVPPCLPMVTGTHSRETITYVERIMERHYPAML